MATLLYVGSDEWKVFLSTRTIQLKEEEIIEIVEGMVEDHTLNSKLPTSKELLKDIELLNDEVSELEEELSDKNKLMNSTLGVLSDLVFDLGIKNES